jgi:Domain of unknown function (DUF4410)
MNATSISKRVTLAGMFTVFALSVSAAKAPSTAPGKYAAWGPDIDEVEIVRSFQAVDYANIFVERLDVSTTPAAEDVDVAGKVSSVLADATTPFVEGVKRKIGALMVLDALPADPARTLIVRTKVTMMEPGSRSKRMFVGYGAGAARAAITSEIVDAKSGEVLVRFTQERRSGIERFGRGSSYEEIMKRNLVALGQDVANLLKVF